MDGFHRNSGDNAMKYWDGGQLPFYWDLAQTFVLCDRWFASAPCQTYPNRRYLQAATSVGMVSTDPQAVLDHPDAPNGTIWDRLNDQGISWNDYAFDLPDILLFPKVHGANGSHLRTFQNFLYDAKAGTLPQVSIVSPGFETYTEENPHDVQLGEAYSARVINAVLDSPAWDRTVVFFTYDEHGGYYDHVPPPPAIAPDSILPDVTSPPDAPGGFDLYGFRVPSFVISPFAKAGHTSSTVYDHTSILRFIETKFNLGALTYRDANANDLLDTLDFSAKPFLDPPTLADPGLPASGSDCEPGVPDPKTLAAVRYVPPSSTTTTLPGATTAPGSTVPGSAPGAQALPGQIAFTGTPDLTVPTVVGVSAVAAGFAVLAARHRLLAGDAGSAPGAQADEVDQGGPAG
jgi:phospholipase C